MDDESPISIGELSRRLNDVLIKMDNLIKDLDLKYVNREVYKAHKLASDEKISRLEDTNKWLARTVIGLVISAVVAALLLRSGGQL